MALSPDAAATARPWFKHYPAHVPHSLEYPDITLGDMLAKTAREHGDHAALRLGPFSMSYAELYGAARLFAANLQRLGVKKGARVAIMLPNLPQYVVAYYGTVAMGAIVVQVNPLYVERELAHVLNDSGTETLVVLDALLPRALAVRGETPLRHVVVVPTPGADASASPAATASEGDGASVIPFDDMLKPVPTGGDLPQVASEDVAVFQYTGGTTGVAKGAMLTHRNLVVNVAQLQAWVRNLETDNDKMLTALPLFHVYAMTVCMNYAVWRGASMILLPRFTPEAALQALRSFRPTSFPGVPTMYVAINAMEGVTSDDVSSLNVCNSGGSAMPVEVMRQFEERTGATIIEGYGLSETAPVTHCNPTAGLRKPGSVGIPFPDTDVRIVDLETGERELPAGEQGEICLRGPQVMKGYWNREAETAAALRGGWFYTGDIGRMDEDGYFYITDRKKDMIIASGFNVYPRDVEEVLFEHPAVQEAAVAGVPDEYRGETVKAYLVLKPGATVSEEALDAYCREKLAAYKVPRLYEFRSELPKSAVGKVLKRVLLEEEAARRGKGAAS